MKRKTLFSILTVAGGSLLYQACGLKRAWQGELKQAFKQEEPVQPQLVRESDLADLPQPVQRYLRYTGVIGRERVRNFYILSMGQFKMGPDKKWARAKAEQFSFIRRPRRLYFMKLSLFGLPVLGLHVYKNAAASMVIKVGGLVTVGSAQGEIMNKAETVTILNDMCLMAPASLIDRRIEWKTLDDLTVMATFTNEGIEVSAVLRFNETGELISFTSHDRAMTLNGSTYRSVPWSTPVGGYKEYDGIRLATWGEAHWHLPEGDFCYGRFHLVKVRYNL